MAVVSRYRSFLAQESPTTGDPRRIKNDDAGYPGGVTTEDGDTGSERSRPPRQFGQLPGLGVPNDFDKPLPPTEAAVWEAPDPAAQDADTALDDAWLAWPTDEADLLHDALGN